MRLFTSAFWTATAIGLLAGCSGNMAPTPSAAVPSVAENRAAGANNALFSGANNALFSSTKPGVSRQEVQRLTNVTVALQTSNGDYVTAAYSPIAEPNCGSGQVALHEDATKINVEEKFTLVYDPSTKKYGFKLPSGNYITAVNGGGEGGPNMEYGYSQLHTNATTIGSWEHFKIVPVSSTQVALLTPWNTYVTAIPGCGTFNNVPFHTNATQMGVWEEFNIVRL